MTLSLKSHSAIICKNHIVWLYREGDYERAHKLIDGTDWNFVVSDSDVHKAAERWFDQFLAIVEECIPYQYYKRNIT